MHSTSLSRKAFPQHRSCKLRNLKPIATFQVYFVELGTYYALSCPHVYIMALPPVKYTRMLPTTREPPLFTRHPEHDIPPPAVFDRASQGKGWLSGIHLVTIIKQECGLSTWEARKVFQKTIKVTGEHLCEWYAHAPGRVWVSRCTSVFGFKIIC